MGELNYISRNAVSITSRFIVSDSFDGLYAEGMCLIEQVAAYLDGEGRIAYRALNQEVAVVYAAESMRLTTRLMQLASWLLLQRAVNDGEMEAECARDEKSKVRFAAVASESNVDGWDEMPEGLRVFIKRGDRLFERVMMLDRYDRGVEALPVPNADNFVSAQMARLRCAFER